jgi:hypothetical protein
VVPCRDGKIKVLSIVGGLLDWENNGHACMKWWRFGKYVIYTYLDERLTNEEHGLGGIASLSTSMSSVTKLDTSFPEPPSPPPPKLFHLEILHMQWSCSFIAQLFTQLVRSVWVLPTGSV